MENVSLEKKLYVMYGNILPNDNQIVEDLDGLGISYCINELDEILFKNIEKNLSFDFELNEDDYYVESWSYRKKFKFNNEELVCKVEESKHYCGLTFLKDGREYRNELLNDYFHENIFPKLMDEIDSKIRNKETFRFELNL